MDITGASKTGGLLLAAFQAGTADEIEWAEVTAGDLVITVARDAMKAKLGDTPGVRLPVSYAETITICKALGCVAPTEAMCNAMFAQAGAQLTFVPLVHTAADSAKMATVDFTLKFHAGVQKQLDAAGDAASGLLCGAWKYWILHPRIGEKGAVNYGFWDKSQHPPRVIQTAGAQHDASHWDYSQLLQPVKRTARNAAGEDVDLCDYITQHDKVPARFVDVYR